MRFGGTPFLALFLAACGAEATKPVSRPAPPPASLPPSGAELAEPTAPVEAAAEPSRDDTRARPAVPGAEDEVPNLAEARRKLRARIEALVQHAFDQPRTRTDCVPSLTPEEVSRMAAGQRVDLPVPTSAPRPNDLLLRLGAVHAVRGGEVEIDLFGTVAAKPGTSFLLSRAGSTVATGRITVTSPGRASGRIERVLRGGPPRVGDDVFLR